MKIFYYGYERSAMPLIASYIHLGKLSLNGAPALKEVIRIIKTIHSGADTTGVPVFLGNDENRNEIYAVGFGKDHQLALQTITHLNPDGITWKFYSTLHENDSLISLANLLLNHLRLAELGKKLIALSACRNYQRLVELVKTVKGLNQVG